MATLPQRFVRMFLAFVLTCLAPVVASAQVPQFDSLYAFGDSLLDTGNIFVHSSLLGRNPAVPPSVSPHRTYFDGNFSNGYMEVEFLWQRLAGYAPGSPHGVQPFLKSPLLRRTGAANFAFGGTGTPYVDQTPGGDWAPGLKGQVELFRLALFGRKPSSRALYLIATGANDYRMDQFNPVPMSPVDVAKNIEDSIVTLYRLGARHVMVMDLPDLGKVPANLMSEEQSAAATFISGLHNSMLYPMLDGLRVRFPSLHLVTVRLQPLFDTIPLNKTVPALDDYTPPPPVGLPPQSACLFVAPVLCQDVPTSLFNTNLGYVFWDIAHPTTEAHRHLADYMHSELVNSYD